MKIFAKKKKKCGFTLIELLVVIAIIGILAAIVLVSLQGARNRARDGRIMSNMAQLRGIAEVHFGAQTPNSYLDLCANNDVTTLQADMTNQGGRNFGCHVQAGAGAGATFCIEVQLNNGQWWCVDSALRSQQYNDDPACSAAQAIKSCQP